MDWFTNVLFFICADMIMKKKTMHEENKSIHQHKRKSNSFKNSPLFLRIRVCVQFPIYYNSSRKLNVKTYIAAATHVFEWQRSFANGNVNDYIKHFVNKLCLCMKSIRFGHNLQTSVYNSLVLLLCILKDWYLNNIIKITIYTCFYSIS